MIVVDTNVLSETIAPAPDRAVMSWLAEHASELAITTVTVAEMLYGVGRLPAGKRRSRLGEAVDGLIGSAMEQGRVLSYDHAAARAHARLRIEREAAGRTTSVEDQMIAAIALANAAAVATRNVAHFEGFGLAVLDPWA